MAKHLQMGRGRVILTSPKECCQRGASSRENGREVNCRRDCSEDFFHWTWLQIKLHLNISVSTRFFPMQDCCQILWMEWTSDFSCIQKHHNSQCMHQRIQLKISQDITNLTNKFDFKSSTTLVNNNSLQTLSKLKSWVFLSPNVQNSLHKSV